MGCGAGKAAEPSPTKPQEKQATLLQQRRVEVKAAKPEESKVEAPAADETLSEDPSVFQCMPCDSDAPSKDMGTAKMWINKTQAGRQFTRMKLEAGFDWRAKVKPLLPGCPDWCPATHFGYLESGSMGIKMQDGTEYTINAGETYCVPPGHLPVIKEPTVMMEFSQDPTYTNKHFLEGSGEKPEEMVPVGATFFQCKPCDTAEPTKNMDGLKMFITKQPDGRQVSRVLVDRGMDWTRTVKPLLPGCPDWCPASHFGYLESGRMHIRMQNGSTATINAGESYFVPPGHLPEFEVDTVFVEFSQDQTYTSKDFIEKEA